MRNGNPHPTPAPKGHKWSIGNKGGRNYPTRDLKILWSKLDRSLPNVVDFCSDLIKKAQQLENPSKDDVGNALQAAKILMSKAPERLAGTGDEGKILVQLD